jgi:hypothetical protein
LNCSLASIIILDKPNAERMFVPQRSKSKRKEKTKQNKTKEWNTKQNKTNETKFLILCLHLTGTKSVCWLKFENIVKA